MQERGAPTVIMTIERYRKKMNEYLDKMKEDLDEEHYAVMGVRTDTRLTRSKSEAPITMKSDVEFAPLGFKSGDIRPISKAIWPSRTTATVFVPGKYLTDDAVKLANGGIEEINEEDIS